MKKVISIIIILSILVFSNCNIAYATGTTETVVSGGPVAGGGVAGNGNASIDIASVLASLVLYSQGLTVSMASDSEKLPTEYISDLLQDFAEAIGRSLETFASDFINGVKVQSDGTFSFLESNLIYQWLNYVLDQNLIVDISNISNVCYIKGIACPVVMPGQAINLYHIQNAGVSYDFGIKNETSNSDFVVFGYEDSNIKGAIILKKGQAEQFVFYKLSNNSISPPIVRNNGQLRNGLFFYNGLNQAASAINQFYIPVISGSYYDTIDSLNGELNIVIGRPNEDGILGDPENVNPSSFVPSEGNVITINPNILPDSGGITSIKNYLDTLKDLINGVDNPSLPVNNTSTGLLEDVPITAGLNNVSVSETTDSNDGTDIIDYNAFPDKQKTQEYLERMKFNLINVFPFCIPFDLVNLVSKLDVPPVTPNVHLSFNNPVLDDPLVLDLNFSQWDSIAFVVRRAEVFAFVVGLALITRNLIRG